MPKPFPLGVLLLRFFELSSVSQIPYFAIIGFITYVNAGLRSFIAMVKGSIPIQSIAVYNIYSAIIRISLARSLKQFSNG